jgi:hypothetical protein
LPVLERERARVVEFVLRASVSSCQPVIRAGFRSPRRHGVEAAVHLGDEGVEHRGVGVEVAGAGGLPVAVCGAGSRAANPSS